MKTRKFDLDIYPLNFIQLAATAYISLAHVTVVPHGKFATCFFSKCKYDEVTTVNEFSNYIIDLIGSRGNQNGNY